MRYFQALARFCPVKVWHDLWDSVVMVIFCVLWLVAVPFMALFEMFRPGVLDRKIFEWSRNK